MRFHEKISAAILISSPLLVMAALTQVPPNEPTTEPLSPEVETLLLQVQEAETRSQAMTAKELLREPSREAQRHDLLDAIWKVESGMSLRPPLGDNGRARGPFQIHRVYWADAIEHQPELGGRYEDVDGYVYARSVVLAYWDRYGPNGSLEELARIHNGGPRGGSKQATEGYWRKVKAEMERSAQQ